MANSGRRGARTTTGRRELHKGIVWANFSRGGKPVESGCGGSLSLPARLDQLGPKEACSSGGGARPDNPVDWFKQLFSQNEEAIPERG